MCYTRQLSRGSNGLELSKNYKFFLLKQSGLFMGLYGVKMTTYWRAPVWKHTHVGTVTPSECPISTQTVVRTRTRALGDPKALCTTAALI